MHTITLLHPKTALEHVRSIALLQEALHDIVDVLLSVDGFIRADNSVADIFQPLHVIHDVKFRQDRRATFRGSAAAASQVSRKRQDQIQKLSGIISTHPLVTGVGRS